jgi:conjugal transfer ATP-binding protein TraC
MMSVESKKGRYSECSIWGPDVNGIIARLYMDPFSLLMMSTNPTDKTALAEKAGLGLNLVDSITAVLQERGLA